MDFADFARAFTGQRREGVARVALRRIPSTQVLARNLLGEYASESLPPPEADLAAWEQTDGVGRGRHAWSSPAGRGLYVTMIRSLTVAAASLPLLVPASLCETLNRHVDGRCRLRWPNDLQIGERKLAGVLVDVVTRGDVSSALLGFGVNVSGEEEYGEPRAISIDALAGRAPSPAELATELIAAVDRDLASAAAIDEAVERYRALSLHRPGDRLRCRSGAETLEGTFRGFDRYGFLRLQVDGEERRVSAGRIEA